MATYKNNARTMGVLYILGTASGILSRVITAPVQSSQDFLLGVSANVSQITWGAFFVMVMGSALAMVPVMAYPILRKQDESLALGYVVFRGGLEGMYYMAIVVSWLFLLPLSQIYQAGSPQASDLLVLGNVLFEAKEIASFGMIVFCLGGLMFYSLLYRTKLVPRWLSGWGLIALLLNLPAGLLVMFGLFSATSTASTVMQLPIFLQEIVLAVWLIVKGFDPAAIEAV